MSVTIPKICSTQCGLYESCKRKNGLAPSIDCRLSSADKNTILVVGDYTDHKDDPFGYFNSDDRGYRNFIKPILEALDCNYVFTTALACPVNDKETNIQKKHYRACFEVKLKPLILKYKPKAIICLGKAAMDAVLQDRAPKSLKTITQTGMSVEFYEEEHHEEVLNSLVIGLNHPIAFKHPKTDIDKLETLYRQVFTKAEDFCINAEKRLPVLYDLIETPAQFAQFIQKVPKKFAFDIENTYAEKDIYKNTIWKVNTKIISLSVTYRDSKGEYKTGVVVGEAVKDKALIQRLFYKRHVVAHNIKHDCNGIFRLCGVDIWPLVEDYEDTMAKFYLADQNRQQNDLKSLSAKYLEVYDYVDDVKRHVVEANNRIAALRKQLIANAREKLKHANWYDEALIWQRGEANPETGKPFSSAKIKNLKMVLEQYSSKEELLELLKVIQEEVNMMPAEGTADYGDIPISILGAYNAEDTVCTLRLEEEILPYLSKYDPSFGRQDPLWSDTAYTLFKRSVRMATYVERNGLPIDIESLNKMGKDLEEKELEVRQGLLKYPEVIQALESLPHIQARKEKGTLTDEMLVNEISPTKAKFMTTLCKNLKLGRFAAETKGGSYSFTGKEVVKKIATFYENKGATDLARLFKDFIYIGNNRQVRSKFIKNWNQYYVPEDKCFHPIFKLTKNQSTLYANKDASGDGGAGSGRLSSAKINSQQIRKVRYLRKHFKARKGYKFAEFDYCQLEVYVIAWLSGCEQLKETFRRGLDIYRVTANEIFLVGTNNYVDTSDPDTEKVNKLLKAAISTDMRNKMKVGFLAWAYGRSKPSFARDLNLSEEETDDFYSKAEKKWHEIFTWKQEIIQDIKDGNPITTPWGRFRTAPIAPPEPNNWQDRKRYDIELKKLIRSVVNFPPQCLPGNTQVLTEAGYVNITEAYNYRVWDGENWRSCRLIESGSKELWEIKTTSGIIQTSGDHRFETPEGWVTAKDLVKDTVLLKKDSFAPQGSYWGEESFAEFIGHMIGDGTYNQSDSAGLIVGATEKDLVDWVTPLLLEWQGPLSKAYENKPKLSVVPYRYKGNISYYKVGVKKSVVKKMYEHGLVKGTSDNKMIPENVFTARPEIRAAVLRGLFNSDGGIRGTGTDGFHIEYTTVSKELAYGVLRLLSSLGITANVKNSKSTSSKPVYRVDVKRCSTEDFAKHVGFRSERKVKLLNVVLEYNKCIQPWSIKSSKTSKVISVTSLNTKEQMYDLEVSSERHAFVTDGLSVHNSSGSDICLWMASNINEWIQREGLQDVIRIVNLVHDAIWFEIKETQLEWAAEKITQMMEDVSSLPFNFDIPLRTEWESGYTMADYIKNDEEELTYV